MSVRGLHEPVPHFQPGQVLSHLDPSQPLRLLHAGHRLYQQRDMQRVFAQRSAIAQVFTQGQGDVGTTVDEHSGSRDDGNVAMCEEFVQLRGRHAASGHLRAQQRQPPRPTHEDREEHYRDQQWEPAAMEELHEVGGEER